MFWNKKSKKQLIICDRPTASVIEGLELEIEADEIAVVGTAGDFINTLIEEGNYRDAIRVAVPCLGRSEAMLWALDCLADVSQSSEPCELLSRVREWAKEPGATTRRQVVAVLQADRVMESKTWLGLAVFFSESPLAFKSDEPGTPVDPSLFGKALSGAVMLAATFDGEKEVGEKDASSRYDRFLKFAANRSSAMRP